MKNLLLVLFISFSAILFAQTENEERKSFTKSPKQLYIGLEGGMNYYSCTEPDYSFIRAQSNQYESYSTTTLHWFFNQHYINALAEFRLVNDKFWVSTGLRYSGINAALGKLYAFDSNDEFFYIHLDNTDDQNTNFYRVVYIQENINYLGIPLSVRYSPFLPRFFRLYFKAGMDINFLISKKNEVKFHDDNLQYRENEILVLFDESENYYSTVSLGVGFQLGKQNKPNFRIEANFPTFLISPDSFSYLHPNFGGGFNLVFLYPLNK